MQFDTDFFRYRNLVSLRVRALLYSVKKTGMGFLVPVIWYRFLYNVSWPLDMHLYDYTSMNDTRT